MVVLNITSHQPLSDIAKCSFYIFFDNNKKTTNWDFVFQNEFGEIADCAEWFIISSSHGALKLIIYKL